MERPLTREISDSSRSVWVGNRKPPILPSITQYWRAGSELDTNSCGRYFCSYGSRYSQVLSDSTTWASASMIG